MKTVNVEGKRLMLIGGVGATCEIIREAHKLGVEVLETDYLPDSPAKKLADKSFMTSCTDVDAVVSLCQQEKVDGVFTGYTDSLLPYVEQICRKLNKPFWGNAENIDVCIDKMKFKAACQKAGVKTVPCITVTLNDYEDKIKNVKCPVVVKPVDNSGSRGVFKCFNQSELKEYCIKSFSFSKKKELLIERMMNVNNEFSAYYILAGGSYKLCSMGDRYVDVVDENTAPQAKGMLFPSIHLDDFINKADSSIRDFFKQNNMNDGFVFIQGFAEDDNFFISEIGYRLNGGFTYKFNEIYNGYNQLQELLCYSLTGTLNPNVITLTNPHFDGFGLLVTISLKEGIIGKIDGIEEIRSHNGIYDFVQQHEIGDNLSAHGTSAQIFGYAFCFGKTQKELNDIVTFIKNKLTIEDVNHNNMLIGIIDASSLRLRY